MIYDAGLMGIFVPFTLYYVYGNSLMEWTGAAGVVKFPSQHGGIKVVRSTMDGSLMVCCDLANVHDPPITGRAYGYNNSTGNFTYMATRNGYSATEVYSGSVKMYGSGEVTIVGSVNRIVRVEPGYGDGIDYCIVSRDNELFAHYDNKIWKNNGDNFWSELLTASRPRRMQAVGADYYYDSGNFLKTQAGTVKAFDAAIIDFYIAAESVVLTNDGIYWLDGSFNIVSSTALVGVKSTSMITIAGGFMAINLTTRIVVFIGHNFFYDMTVATDYTAITSNND